MHSLPLFLAQQAANLYFRQIGVSAPTVSPLPILLTPKTAVVQHCWDILKISFYEILEISIEFIYCIQQPPSLLNATRKLSHLTTLCFVS
jgi:hypothetical protein